MSKTSPSKVKPVKDEEVEALKNRVLKEERLVVSEFDIVLRKAAQDVHHFVKKNKNSPIEYLSEKIGVSTSAINSYFFTGYGIFQKDLEAKMHPYIAFTLGLVHAINIGYILGEMKGGNHGPSKSSDTRKAASTKK